MCTFCSTLYFSDIFNIFIVCFSLKTCQYKVPVFVIENIKNNTKKFLLTKPSYFGFRKGMCFVSACLVIPEIVK